MEEREATMQQAQELSDQLGTANKDREQLQQDLISSTGQVDELQAQLDELMARLVLMEYWVDMMVDLLAAISRYSRRVWVSPLLSNKN